MKKLKYNRALLILLVILFSAAGTKAQSDSTDAKKDLIKVKPTESEITKSKSDDGDIFIKTYKHEWVSDQQSLLDLNNRFGDMTINNWADNKINIEVIITAKTANEEKAKKIISKINIDFSEQGNTRKVATKLDDLKTSTDFKIDYIVSVPVYLNMNLNNKYGNIKIDETQGKSNINVKYGKLIANKLHFEESKPLCQVLVGYGKANIKEITRAKLVSSYSEVKVGKASALIIVSKFSEIDITEIKSLVADSKYDEYDVGTLKGAVIVGKYGDFSIDRLKKKLDMDVKYTSCAVKNVASDFSDITFENRYGNIEISIDEGASYTVDALGEYCNISYPKNHNLEVKHDFTDISVIGTVGDESEPSSSIRIRTKYGNVDID